MNQVLGLINLSLVPLRAKPTHGSEMVSQLLFGDCLEVLDTESHWAYVRTFFDDYEGWIDQKQFVEIDPVTRDQFVNTKWVLGLSVKHPVVNLHTNQILYLVPGSSIPDLVSGQFGINGISYEVQSPVIWAVPPEDGLALVTAAQFYLNTPYLWGGRSPFGVDCSGFSQLVFKQFGICLKRDTYLQAEQGALVDFLAEARAGDLAFFDNEQGRIIHVGIMVNNHQIIHASGSVKIDPIDNQGIFSEDLQRYTHKLRIIKRIIN